MLFVFSSLKVYTWSGEIRIKEDADSISGLLNWTFNCIINRCKNDLLISPCKLGLLSIIAYLLIIYWGYLKYIIAYDDGVWKQIIIKFIDTYMFLIQKLCLLFSKYLMCKKLPTIKLFWGTRNIYLFLASYLIIYCSLLNCVNKYVIIRYFCCSSTSILNEFES